MLLFKKTTSAEIAHNNTKWLHELGNDTKLVKPWFGVAVHRVLTLELEEP